MKTPEGPQGPQQTLILQKPEWALDLTGLDHGNKKQIYHLKHLQALLICSEWIPTEHNSQNTNWACFRGKSSLSQASFTLSRSLIKPSDLKQWTWQVGIEESQTLLKDILTSRLQESAVSLQDQPTEPTQPTQSLCKQLPANKSHLAVPQLLNR